MLAIIGGILLALGIFYLVGILRANWTTILVLTGILLIAVAYLFMWDWAAGLPDPYQDHVLVFLGFTGLWPVVLAFMFFGHAHNAEAIDGWKILARTTCVVYVPWAFIAVHSIMVS